MKISISRFDPERDERPHLQDYEIERVASDHMLLDVLLRLKAEDPTLSFRKSCREGVCGSDAMNINGRNGLACSPPEKERLQSPAEREKLNGAYECILCACCTSQCPSYWWNPEKFVGPAGLIQAYRFIFDSRDRATAQRLDDLDRDPYRLFRFRTIMNCAEVCPKGLEPVHAIERIRLKIAGVGDHTGGLDVHPPIAPR